ncbi:unnamed protein product [Rhizoctonia solani]|uniref:Malate dehydrogenase n=1 Tax=Rhizoctonia solani TaxID=456999 RepID=A0A8H3HQT7_9AGAM|nr:unnamed protein product [Rhizoctonia solani]
MIFPVFSTAIAFFASAIVASAEKTSGCDVSAAKIVLPPGLSIPRGVKPLYITVGIGTQNYTCSSSGTYNAAGAVANLVDMSCAYTANPNLFNNAESWAYALFSNWQYPLKPYIDIIGKHYFITENGSGAPKFDFAQSGKGYVVTKKIGGVPSPDGSENVDWLELQNTSGNLAKYVFRVNTIRGQPPASCRAGQTLTVKYTAKYWFFG